MRVFSVLSLLCICILGVSGQTQYVLDGTSASPNWVLTGVTGNNPPLTFTAGNTYTFDASATPNHPFNFSTVPLNTVVTPLDPTYYTVSGSTGCNMNRQNAFAVSTASAAGTCVVTLMIAANAPAATIYYQCAQHQPMSGMITVLAATANGTTTAAPTTAAPTTPVPTTATPTTASPTNGTATTAAPTTSSPTNGTATTATPTTASPTNGTATTASPTTSSPTNGTATTAPPTTASPTGTPAPTTGGMIASNTFHVTGNNGTSAFLFTANGVVYANPTLQVTAGMNVTFSFEWSNSYYHPFGFSNNSATDAVAATSSYFPANLSTFILNTPSTCDVGFAAVRTVRVANGTTSPCVITIPTSINDTGLVLYYRCAVHPKMVGMINVVAPGSGSSSSSTGGTGGNGGNSASTIAVSGLTLVVAIIAAIMA